MLWKFDVGVEWADQAILDHARDGQGATSGSEVRLDSRCRRFGWQVEERKWSFGRDLIVDSSPIRAPTIGYGSGHTDFDQERREKGTEEINKSL